MNKYLVTDPEGGYHFYDTEEEAISDAKEFISDTCDPDEGWLDNPTTIGVFMLIHSTEQVNYKNRPPDDELDDEGCDSDGVYWSDQWASMCDYKLKEVTEKPDWSTAPDWANYVAQDHDGKWYWFEKMPFLDESHMDWYPPKDSECKPVLHAVDHWKETLEARPDE